MSGTITLGNNLPKIEKNIKITGPSLKNIDISGNDEYQIFDIGVSAIVEISNLNLNDASMNGEEDENCSAAIYNAGNLTITNVKFSNNHTNGSGGAIQSNTGSTLVVNNSTFISNTATSMAGAIYAYDCTTTINNCIFDGNLSDTQGGAILADKGNITITSSTFRNNNSIGGGSDIFILDGAILTNNSNTFDKNGGAGEIYTN
ncbi:hypothetical protein [Clostridium tagluense]|uniref:hypothetical protein n=1 Tax=Clostridium tagluense TaxID=360422 RepID=UPI001CF42DA5|nr:hypothetical protein [Clostridium tagluense]MCB2301101.1 hypothetical protein [Clostridium tagluense]